MTYNSEMDNSIQNSDLFDGNEFVFNRIQKPDGTTEIIGGGYIINSFFLQDDIPAMTTLNDQQQDGGKPAGTAKVSSPFENLAVPAGLFYINQKIPKNNVSLEDEKQIKKHEMISDDIMDKLFGLVDADKKRKRKTRKNNGKLNKQKTRKNF
jgi:hypothetical protein